MNAVIAFFLVGVAGLAFGQDLREFYHDVESLSRVRFRGVTSIRASGNEAQVFFEVFVDGENARLLTLVDAAKSNLSMQDWLSGATPDGTVSIKVELRNSDYAAKLSCSYDCQREEVAVNDGPAALSGLALQQLPQPAEYLLFLAGHQPSVVGPPPLQISPSLISIKQLDEVTLSQMNQKTSDGFRIDQFQTKIFGTHRGIKEPCHIDCAWAFDGENRLLYVTSVPNVADSENQRTRLEFDYSESSHFDFFPSSIAGMLPNGVELNVLFGKLEVDIEPSPELFLVSHYGIDEPKLPSQRWLVFGILLAIVGVLLLGVYVRRQRGVAT